MNKENQKTTGSMIGASSLLVIFAILCMTVFSLLGLSTVSAHKRLSDIQSQAFADYYAADCHAEEILAQLRCGQIPQGVVVDGAICRYTCPISPTQELRVEVDRGDWSILRWQAVSTVNWKADESMTVWDGSADSED